MKEGVNKATISLLSSLLEIFATVRSALATYAISMAVTNGDQSFSLFTVAVVEGALILSMMSIGLDAVSPLTAIAALIFSGVMQYLEIATLQGALDAQQKQILLFALAFCPTVLLALGILRRLAEGGNTGALGLVLGRMGGLFKPASGESKSYAFDVPTVQKTWKEKREVVRWRDSSGRTHSKYVPTVQKGKGKKKRARS